ncbi:MAG: hypothetical protein K2L88_06915 [Clostridiales bacterium]|nr:hypothetical protein [Clostridiales bacterium]
MTNNNYDKIRLVILRAVLVAIGGGMGYLALWQYFLFYPNIIRREYQIVITVVSAALIALIFGLSAKAVYRLASSVAVAARGLKDNVGVRGIIAVLLGFAAAGVLVTVFDVIIRRVVDIWAVRLLADVLAYIFGAALACVGFTKWLNAPKSENGKSEKALPAVGYLIAAECFTDERVLTAVYTLINVKVCDGAYKALCLYGGEKGAEGARLMDALIKNGVISVLNTKKEFNDEAEYIAIERRLAEAKRLKPIVLNATENEQGLAVFSPPTEQIMQAVIVPCQKPTEAVKTEEKTSDIAAAGDINGQIIIDK